MTATINIRPVFDIKLDSTFKHFGYFSLIWFKLEGRQETQRTEVKCHDWRDAALQKSKTTQSSK